jgi:hypothetical protein
VNPGPHSTVSSTKTFEINVEEGVDAASILARAQDAARGAGIVIAGNGDGGTFRGTAQGSYVIDEAARLVRVEVTSKPGFVPWTMIESALRKVFK